MYKFTDKINRYTQVNTILFTIILTKNVAIRGLWNLACYYSNRNVKEWEVLGRFCTQIIVFKQRNVTEIFYT